MRRLKNLPKEILNQQSSDVLTSAAHELMDELLDKDHRMAVFNVNDKAEHLAEAKESLVMLNNLMGALQGKDIQDDEKKALQTQLKELLDKTIKIGNENVLPYREALNANAVELSKLKALSEQPAPVVASAHNNPVAHVRSTMTGKVGDNRMPALVANSISLLSQVSDEISQYEGRNLSILSKTRGLKVAYLNAATQYLKHPTADNFKKFNDAHTKAEAAIDSSSRLPSLDKQIFEHATQLNTALSSVNLNKPSNPVEVDPDKVEEYQKEYQKELRNSSSNKPGPSGKS